jgi:hypothetical protein
VSQVTDQRREATHAVCFYDAEVELARVVADHLAPALAGGGTAVVAATAERTNSFAERLAESGSDPTAAMAGGHLLVVDAEEVATELVSGGGVDRARFDDTVGSLMARAGGSSGPVKVYGEIVAVLWERGEQGAALSVESLWNELLGRQRFDLLCAYPSSIEVDPPQMAGLCATHDAVDGAPRTGTAGLFSGRESRSFGGTLRDPAEARHFVVRLLAGRGLAGLGDDAALVVTELAANAMLHGGGAFSVEVLPRLQGIRIVVGDGSTSLPVRQEPGPARHGQGLRIVDALAADWGVYRAPDGTKTVWADLG